MSSDWFEHRLRDAERFYSLLDILEQRVGGKRTLSQADAKADLPRRGVYFFFEMGEDRTTSGSGLRVVRVGTHAVRRGSQRTLWSRLSTHRGTLRGANPGGGNHRGSVFRHHVGTALIRRDNWPDTIAGEWTVPNNAPKPVRIREYPLESAVSDHIWAMPFLWLAVDDEPGRESSRAYIERNAIALLSNYDHQDAPVDPPSPEWLGRFALSPEIPRSGLWNVDYVSAPYKSRFLDVLHRYIDQMR